MRAISLIHLEAIIARFRQFTTQLEFASLRAIRGWSYLPIVATVSALVLTMGAVLAGAMGAWRLGADPGWTNSFFITHGWLSRYQSWFALAIGAQGAAVALNRWVGYRNMDLAMRAL